MSDQPNQECDGAENNPEWLAVKEAWESYMKREDEPTKSDFMQHALADANRRLRAMAVQANALKKRVEELEDKLAIAIEALGRLSGGDINPITYSEIAADAILKIDENQ